MQEDETREIERGDLMGRIKHVMTCVCVMSAYRLGIIIVVSDASCDMAGLVFGSVFVFGALGR